MHPARTRSGFTLIELLTVIAIIAILMGLLLPAVTAAKNAAKKASAKTDLTQLVTAVKQFYTDYGVYPVAASVSGTPADVEYGGTPSATGISGSNNSVIVDVLRANTNDPASSNPNNQLSNQLNSRQIVYLDVPNVKTPTTPKSGLGTGAGSTVAGNWYDPWGNPYIVGIDANYDGFVTGGVLEKYKDSGMYITNPGTAGGVGLQTGCVAGSFGGDGTQGTGNNQTYSGSDDVLSWE